MGEIFNALEVLNRTMKLGLGPNELLGAEMAFKSALVTHGNPDPNLPADPIELAQGYELKASLRPRQEELSLAQLSTYARKEVAKPRVRVDAKAKRQIDKAIKGLDTTGPGGTGKARAKPDA